MFTFGIIGGMGPMATVDLFQKIVQHTPVETDQEHIRIIIDNHPQIPSRITAILAGTENPLPYMVESAQLLERAGVSCMAMACNTAHYWYDGVQESVKTPVVHIIDNAARYVAESQSKAPGPILLLATAATIKTGLYQQTFQRHGICLLQPNAAEQQNVAAAIDAAKAGKIADNPYLPELTAMLHRYHAQGVQAVIGGCTEIPLLFPFLPSEVKQYDPTDLLAQEVVRRALGQAVH